MQIPQPARPFVLWSATHGLPRLLFRREARSGKPLARLVTTPALIEDPRPVWEEVRAHGPLMEGDFGYITASHRVASAVLRSEDFGVMVFEGDAIFARVVQAARDPWTLGPVDPPSLLAIDAPDHTRLRRLVARSFTVRRVEAMRGDVEKAATRLLDEIQASGGRRLDLVTRYAAQLPISVIADLLGVPEDEREPFLHWGNSAAALLDAGLAWREFRDAQRGLREMHHWVAGHLDRLRRDPGDDVLSGVVSTVEQLPPEERPSDDELRLLALLLLGAGFETTVNLISNGVAQLSAHPDQLDRLRADPSLWPTAVEEVLRFDSPVTMTGRLAKRDVDLAALTGIDGLPVVRRGQGVITLIGALNRDPEIFTDAERFDVARANAAEHLAFSAGAHFCLGSGLARLEGQVALRALYDRFPDLRVDGVPVRRGMHVLRGYDALPVRV